MIKCLQSASRASASGPRRMPGVGLEGPRVKPELILQVLSPSSSKEGKFHQRPYPP